MICKHLRELESAIINDDIRETFRGQPWAKNCHEWVYFDCILDLSALRERFTLATCVEDHEHIGTLDGCEQGFYCNLCYDGVMGIHPRHGEGKMFK